MRIADASRYRSQNVHECNLKCTDERYRRWRGSPKILRLIKVLEETEAVDDAI